MDIVLDQLISILFEYWIPAAVIIGLNGDRSVTIDSVTSLHYMFMLSH